MPRFTSQRFATRRFRTLRFNRAIAPTAFHPSQYVRPGDLAIIPALSDFSNMWQDAGGTVPAALDQQVYRIDSEDGSFTLTSDVAAERPLLRMVSGYPCLVYDGTNDVLGRAPLQSVQTATEFTIACVVQVTGAAGGQTRPWGLAEVDGTNGTNSFQPACDGSIRLDGDFIAGTLSPDFSVPTVRISSRSGTRVRDWIDGQVNIDQDVPTLGSTHFNPISMYFVGPETSGETSLWAPLIITRDFTDAQRANIDQWCLDNSPAVRATVNQPPVAVNDTASTAFETALTFDPRANDSDPENGTLTIQSASVSAPEGTISVNSGVSITFTPATGFSGDATITYTIVDDGGLTDTAIVTVTVATQVAIFDPELGLTLTQTVAPGEIMPNATYAASATGSLVLAFDYDGWTGPGMVDEIGGGGRGIYFGCRPNGDVLNRCGNGVGDQADDQAISVIPSAAFPSSGTVVREYAQLPGDLVRLRYWVNGVYIDEQVATSGNATGLFGSSDGAYLRAGGNGNTLPTYDGKVEEFSDVPAGTFSDLRVYQGATVTPEAGSAPVEITDLSAAPGNSLATLTWTPSLGAVYQDVYQDTGSGPVRIGQIGGAVGSYLATGLTNDSLHSFSVIPRNPYGAPNPAFADVTPYNLAITPSYIRGFTARDGYQVHLVMPTEDGSVEFQFEVDGVLQPYQPFRFFAPEGLTGTQTFNVRGRGRDVQGSEGGWSDMVTVTIDPSLPPLLTFQSGTTVNAYDKYGAMIASLTFSQPVLFSYCAEGRPLILTDRDMSGVSDFPACTPTGVAGRLRGGMMLDPWFLVENRQGYDAQMANASKATLRIAYDDKLNVSPTKPGGSPIAIPRGFQGRLVKNVPSGNSFLDQPTAYQPIFTFIATKYANDVLRPPLAAKDALPMLFERDIDLTGKFEALTPPQGGFTYSAAFANLPQDISEWIQGLLNGEQRNCATPHEGREGSSGYNYAGINGRYRIRAMYALHSNLTDQEKFTLARRICLFGQDLTAAGERGDNGNGGAGQNHFSGPPLIFTWFLTGSRRIREQARIRHTTMMRLTDRGNIKFITNEDMDTKKIVSSNAGRDKVYPFPPSSIGEVYVDQTGEGIPINAGYNIYAWGQAAYQEVLPCALLKNDADGLTGAQWIMRRLGNTTDALSKDNPASAPLVCMLGAMTMRNEFNTNWPNSLFRAYHDSWVPMIGLPPYVGKPLPPDQPKETGIQRMTTTATGLRFTLNNIGYSFLAPNHEARLYYSIDGMDRSYIVINKNGVTDVQIPTHMPVYHTLAVADAAGVSPIYQPQDRIFQRSDVPANTPCTFARPPRVVYKYASQWPGQVGEEVDDVIATEIPRFWCGTGEVLGFPRPVYNADGAGDFKFHPIWNGVEDGTVNHPSDYLAPKESGTLQFRLEVSNGIGPVAEAYTNIINVPAIAPLPARVVVDTHFTQLAERALAPLDDRVVAAHNAGYKLVNTTGAGFDSPGYLASTKTTESNHTLRYRTGEIGVTGARYLINAQIRIPASADNRVSIRAGSVISEISQSSPYVMIDEVNNVMTITDYPHIVPESANGQELTFDHFLSGTNGRPELRIGRLKVRRIT